MTARRCLVSLALVPTALNGASAVPAARAAVRSHAQASPHRRWSRGFDSRARCARGCSLGVTRVAAVASALRVIGYRSRRRVDRHSATHCQHRVARCSGPWSSVLHRPCRGPAGAGRAWEAGPCDGVCATRAWVDRRTGRCIPCRGRACDDDERPSACERMQRAEVGERAHLPPRIVGQSATAYQQNARACCTVPGDTDCRLRVSLRGAVTRPAARARTETNTRLEDTGVGQTDTAEMAPSWETLRKDARRLETEIDAKLVTYSKLAASLSTSTSRTSGFEATRTGGPDGKSTCVTWCERKRSFHIAWNGSRSHPSLLQCYTRTH